MSRRFPTLLVALAFGLLGATHAEAFCGFYVAKADTKMFNHASRVAIARADDRTVITMANDYQGEPSDFALVIPTPTVLQESQINVAEPALIDHLDAYTAPRLVEYFDSNPCDVRLMRRMSSTAVPAPMADGAAAERAAALGVAVEAEYSVGEYDIQILSAAQSSGLLTFLTENGYRLPDGAAPMLEGYIKQGMKFFVAKVNLDAHAARNVKYLRPLQIAFESEMFMLPIRLGTLNADQEQELFVFTLTREGRVEAENYRTKPAPTGVELPIFVKAKFGDFYRDMFTELVRKDPGVVFTEYAWDMNWCDPCAADPLSRAELRTLGAWWVGADDTSVGIKPVPLPGRPQPRPVRPVRPRGLEPIDVFVTRMHIRYTAESHEDDLAFRETKDRENFQARYVLRHPWTGDDSCDAASAYRDQLKERWEKEAQTLANLTAWAITDIRAKQPTPADMPEPKPWWEDIWNK